MTATLQPAPEAKSQTLDEIRIEALNSNPFNKIGKGLSGIGGFYSFCLKALRSFLTRGIVFDEFVTQSWFISTVSIVPAIMPELGAHDHGDGREGPDRPTIRRRTGSPDRRAGSPARPACDGLSASARSAHRSKQKVRCRHATFLIVTYISKGPTQGPRHTGQWTP